MSSRQKIEASNANDQTFKSSDIWFLFHDHYTPFRYRHTNTPPHSTQQHQRHDDVTMNIHAVQFRAAAFAS